VPQVHKNARNRPLTSFPCASALRSRMEPSTRFSERSRNICELKTKHLSQGLLTNISVAATIQPVACANPDRGPTPFFRTYKRRSDGNQLSCCTAIRCTCNKFPIRPSLYLQQNLTARRPTAADIPMPHVQAVHVMCAPTPMNSWIGNMRAVCPERASTVRSQWSGCRTRFDCPDGRSRCP
jgi:hypothetical protein